jgi:hypothetical protein
MRKSWWPDILKNKVRVPWIALTLLAASSSQRSKCPFTPTQDAAIQKTQVGWAMPCSIHLCCCANRVDLFRCGLAGDVQPDLHVSDTLSSGPSLSLGYAVPSPLQGSRQAGRRPRAPHSRATIPKHAVVIAPSNRRVGSHLWTRSDSGRTDLQRLCNCKWRSVAFWNCDGPTAELTDVPQHTPRTWGYTVPE